MSLVRYSLIFLCVLVGSQVCFAQDDKADELASWDVTCNMPVAEHQTSPCEGFSAEGANFSFTRDVLINSSINGTHVTLTFKRSANESDRSLEVIEVTPARDMDNENQEYWFSGGLQGPGGVDSDSYFVTLRFFGKNPQNSKNGRGGWTENGTYNGRIKFKDTKSDAVFTINLTANVKSLESKKN